MTNSTKRAIDAQSSNRRTNKRILFAIFLFCSSLGVVRTNERTFFMHTTRIKIIPINAAVIEYKEGLDTENFHKGVTTSKAKTAQKRKSTIILARKEKNFKYVEKKAFFCIYST